MDTLTPLSVALSLAAVQIIASADGSIATSNSGCTGFQRVQHGIANAEIALGSPLADNEDDCCAVCASKLGCTAWTYHGPNDPDPTMRKKCWLMPYAAKPHGTGVVSGVGSCPALPCTDHPGKTYCPSISTPGQCNQSSHPPCPPCKAPASPPVPKPATPPPAGPTESPPLGFRPNIVFILTDDQDKQQDSMDAMPKTRSLFGLDDVQTTSQAGQPITTSGCAGGGSCFSLERGYVATPICCPSRSSYLTGKYIHNTGTLQNNAQMGCSSTHWVEEEEPRAYAAFLGAANYTSGFFGKYLNAYGTQPQQPLSYVPPGWSEWCALQGNSRYYNYVLSVNGKEERHGEDYATDYLTDLLANRSVEFLRRALASSSKRPVLTVVHTPAPHRPAQPAPQYMTSFTDRKAPRTPSWNAISHDKHRWLSTLEPMNSTTIEYSDHVWRRRLRSLQSVDDLVARVFATVASAPEDAMDRTVFVYSSDHGYHSGQWGVAYCKMLPYEEDVHIPMFVRMPSSTTYPASPNGVARKVEAPTLNIDIAPTLLALAGFGTAAVAEMDGQSMLPLLHVTATASVDSIKDSLSAPDGSAAETSGRAFLIEYFPIPHIGNDVQASPKGQDGWCVDPDVNRTDCPTILVTVDSVNNTWACVRTLVPATKTDTIFCHFYDATGYDLSFVRNQTNFVEFYNMTSEPWQLTNLVHTLSPAMVTGMVAQLEALMSCKGSDQCAKAGKPLRIL